MARNETRKCSKCITKIPTNRRRADSTIALIEGPRELRKVLPDEDEFQLRIWSYMEPPKLSDPMPNLNPERIELVRELLNGTLDEPIETRIDSRVSVQFLTDGTVRKIKSRTEYKVYPPFLTMDKTRIKKFCRPDCTVIEISENEDDATNRRNLCKYLNYY